jgi:hypothetical protein
MFMAPSVPGGAFGSFALQSSRARSKAAGTGVFVVFVRLNMGIIVAR